MHALTSRGKIACFKHSSRSDVDGVGEENAEGLIGMRRKLSAVCTRRQDEEAVALERRDEETAWLQRRQRWRALHCSVAYAFCLRKDTINME